MVDLPIAFKEIELIILDMDGVITSEHAYWDAAGLVIRDLLESSAFLGLSPPDYKPVSSIFYSRLSQASRTEWRKYLPAELIAYCKSRGINSNWDLAYLVAGLYLAPLFASPLALLASEYAPKEKKPKPGKESLTIRYGGEDSIERLQESLAPIWDDLIGRIQKKQWGELLRLSELHYWGAYFRRQGHIVSPVHHVEFRIMDDFTPGVQGLKLLDALNTLLSDYAVYHWAVFGRNTVFWDECQDLFQGWYLGEKLYEETYGQPLLYTPKPGLVHQEEPLHGRKKTHAALSRLRDAGYHLGIATGRPRMEILTPLTHWEMDRYFDLNRIVTHDEVEEAEKELRVKGDLTNIGKPHPFVFLQSIYPEKKALDLIHTGERIPDYRKVLIVGDAPADLWAAREIGCPSVGLLSGAIGPAGRRRLEETKPSVICQNILELADALVSLKR